MAKQLKNRILFSRIDGVMEAQINVYIEAAGLDVSELIRRSIIEYMQAHPLEPAKPVKVVMPGPLIERGVSES